MKMYNKKGVVEAQFNWIFVLVVGGIILLFFVSLVNSQKKTSDLSINSELLTHLDSIIQGASISVGTVYDISMPLTQALSNDCEGQALTFSDSKLQGIDIGRTVLFGPKKMIGTKIFTYSLYWQEPYTITPFLYLTTDSVLFFVVNSTKLSQIFSEIPVNADYNAVDKDGNVKSVLKYGDDYVPDLASLTPYLNSDNDYYTHIKVISTEKLPSGLFHSSTKAKIILYQVPDLVSYDGYFTVNVTEYNRNGVIVRSTVNVDVLGFPSLMGLIFSDDVEDYRCSMTKALTKYQIISKLQLNKSNELKEYVNQNLDFYSPLCNHYYVSSLHEDIIYYINRSIGSDGVTDLTQLSNFQNLVETLRNYNNNLGDKSCPVPY